MSARGIGALQFLVRLESARAFQELNIFRMRHAHASLVAVSLSRAGHDVPYPTQQFYTRWMNCYMNACNKLSNRKPIAEQTHTHHTSAECVLVCLCACHTIVSDNNLFLHVCEPTHTHTEDDKDKIVSDTICARVDIYMTIHLCTRAFRRVQTPSKNIQIVIESNTI